MVSVWIKEEVVERSLRGQRKFITVVGGERSKRVVFDSWVLKVEWDQRAVESWSAGSD